MIKINYKISYELTDISGDQFITADWQLYDLKTLVNIKILANGQEVGRINPSMFLNFEYPEEMKKINGK